MRNVSLFNLGKNCYPNEELTGKNRDICYKTAVKCQKKPLAFFVVSKFSNMHSLFRKCFNLLVRVSRNEGRGSKSK